MGDLVGLVLECVFIGCGRGWWRVGVRGVFPVRNVLREEDFAADAAYRCCVADAHDGAAGGVG